MGLGFIFSPYPEIGIDLRVTGTQETSFIIFYDFIKYENNVPKRDELSRPIAALGD